MRLRMAVEKMKECNQICLLKLNLLFISVDSFQLNQFTKETLTGLLRICNCQAQQSSDMCGIIILFF